MTFAASLSVAEFHDQLYRNLTMHSKIFSSRHRVLVSREVWLAAVVKNKMASLRSAHCLLNAGNLCALLIFILVRAENRNRDVRAFENLLNYSAKLLLQVDGCAIKKSTKSGDIEQRPPSQI
jgi:hypothetical protein